MHGSVLGAGKQRRHQHSQPAKGDKPLPIKLRPSRTCPQRGTDKALREGQEEKTDLEVGKKGVMVTSQALVGQKLA